MTITSWPSCGASNAGKPSEGDLADDGRGLRSDSASEIERLFKVTSDVSGDEVDCFLADLTEEQLRDAPTIAPDSKHAPQATLDTDSVDAVVKNDSHKIGRYTIVGQLGRGGQGEVYRAIHPNLPIELAIKVSVEPMDEAYHQTLKDEAQVLCDLEHPNIARIRDLDFEEGRPFVVLDFNSRSIATRAARLRRDPARTIGCLAGDSLPCYRFCTSARHRSLGSQAR